VVGDNWKLAKALVRAKIEAPLAEDFWKGGACLEIKEINARNLFSWTNRLVLIIGWSHEVEDGCIFSGD